LEAPPGNLRAQAALALEEILTRRQSLKRVVQREQLRIPREDDRALLKEMVAGVVRHLPALDGVLDTLTERGLADTQSLLVNVLRVGAYQLLYLTRIPAYAAVAQCVEAAKMVRPGAAGFANGILRSVAEKGADLLARQEREAVGAAGVAASCGAPLWLAERYMARFGEERARRILTAYQKPAPLCLYIPRADREIEALEALRGEGTVLEPDVAMPRTYRVMAGTPLASQAFRKGLFYLMDPASEVPALLLPVPEGGRVLDLCAAPGGKTVVLAGRGLAGRLVASDLEARRLASMRSNMARLGLAGVDLVQADLEKGLPFTDTFSSVLLDAPCSSLGTLRKNPEIRWQARPEDFAAKARRQGVFLSAAARAVEPGGHLLYAVCSLEPEETTQVAVNFLAMHDQFRTAPLTPAPSLAPFLDEAGEGCAYLMPDRYPWDGFFVALFQRVS
jgi:16S rRNA (cytosine967-C5)-methyltransferase